MQLRRRDILKGMGGGAAVALTGFNAKNSWATDPTIKVVNAAGNFSLVEKVIFEERGYFKKFGVDANILSVSDGSKILAALIGGDGDICGGSGFSGIFPAIEKGADVKLVAGSGLAPVTILYSSRPDIRSVKDLPGQTVGVGAPGALLHEMTVAVMKKYGVDYHKVKFVNIGSSGSVFKALVAGTVAAGVAAIEYRDKAKQFGLYPLVDGEFYKELPLYTYQAMYAPDSAIAAKRDGLVRVMAAYASMFRWIASPDSENDFSRFYKKALGNKTPDDEIHFLWQFLNKPGRLATDLMLSEASLNYIQQLNVELGVQQKVLPFSKVADMSLAKDAVQLLKVKS